MCCLRPSYNEAEGEIAVIFSPDFQTVQDVSQEPAMMMPEGA